MSDSAIGCEFSVNEPTMPYFEKRRTNTKNAVDNTAVRLKDKEIYSHVTQDQENVKQFLASSGWIPCFKR